MDYKRRRCILLSCISLTMLAVLIGFIALLSTRSSGTAGAERPDNISSAEWVPFSPKQVSCFTDVRDTVNLQVSLCAMPRNPKGRNGQTCLPVGFWVNVCSAEVEPYPDLTEENFESTISNHQWERNCFRYPETWPLCVGEEDKQAYCSLWESLPLNLRRYLAELDDPSEDK